MPVRHIHSESDLQSVINSFSNNNGDKLLLIDYSAEWCGPCKMIAPQFESLSNKYGHSHFLFLHVDVDELSEWAGSQQVRALPTFVFYKNGISSEVHRITGADPQSLENKIKELAPQFQAYFSGQGQKLGGTASSTGVAPSSSSSATCNLSAEEIVQIAQANINYSLGGCCRVGFRFQPGIQSGVLAAYKPFVRVNGEEPLSTLRRFLDTLLEMGGVSSRNYQLHNAYPPGPLDESKTVNESGVAGAVVVVKFI